MKGGIDVTDTQMLNYIMETPEVATRLLENFDQEYRSIKIQKPNNVVFVGSGSSLNIAVGVTDFYENELHINVKTYHPDSFLNLKQLNLPVESTLVIGVSQTGTSAGTVNAVHFAQELGFKTIAITERRDTPLAKSGDYYFNFESGEESCNAKSKGYTNSLILLYLLGLKMSETTLDSELVEDVRKRIQDAITEVSQTIANVQSWFENHHDWVRMDNLLVIGASRYMGAADEGALKLSETTLASGSATSVGEFSHGVHRTLDATKNVILLNDVDDDLEQTHAYLSKKVRRVALIDTTGKLANADISVQHLPYGLSAVNVGIIFQVLGYSIPTYLGNDPNEEVNRDYELLVHNRL